MLYPASRSWLFGVLPAIAAVCLGASTPELPAIPPEPKITSIYPVCGEPGKPFAASIRGHNLKDARLIWFAEAGVTAKIEHVESAGPPPSGSAKPFAIKDDVLHAELTINATGSLKSQAFRVITPAGVSNAVDLQVAAYPMAAVDDQQTLTHFPVAVAGKIANRGDVNSHAIAVQANQTLTFEVKSGFKGLDPAISIAERSGSWFDEGRINSIASNDDPLYFPGLSTDARLVHRFQKAGEYLVRVSSFSGQGGPDYTYQLTVTPGETPAPDLHPRWTDLWEERQFTRQLGTDWTSKITQRGAEATASKGVESFGAVREAKPGKEQVNNLPVFMPPGIIEGRIEQPGQTDLIQVKIEKAQDLAIEIETPEATMPRFNPIVRLTEPGGHEVVTNVYTKLNNNGLYMMKMIQAKTAFSLTAPGVYTLQIRDITTDQGGHDFRYRVLVRPQTPHVGKLVSTLDHINLSAGDTQSLSVTLDREEEFAGVVALNVENLPPGVTAIAAMEKPVERPPLPNGGKLERYTPKPQMASLLLVAAPDAKISDQPTLLHVTARPVVKGQLKEALPVAEIPMMVVAGKSQ